MVGEAEIRNGWRRMDSGEGFRDVGGISTATLFPLAPPPLLLPSLELQGERAGGAIDCL